MDRDACLLVNPSAGGGKAARVLPAVEAELRRLGVAFRTATTKSLEHAVELTREAAGRGEAVVTLSGDGLIGAVVGVLRDVPDALLGVLPGGRGNDFARVVGIPLEPVPACAVLVDGEVRDLDIGEVDGRSFIGIASLGFDSVANKLANDGPSWLGSQVYTYAALRALATWKPATFTTEADGVTRTVRGWSVGAANSKAYGGGMYAAPDAELDDGLLDIVSCKECSKRHFLFGILPKIFKGTIAEDPGVEVFRTASVRVSADRPFTVYADGDPIGELPVTIRAVPRALKVLCPRPS
ncbi:MAG: diacylglycerol kinase family lipid kinase [Solirubrobacterales bacterium]|nr:diacylglycerol kinase family lipid kinase [Solirubrobacterales bacterium]